MPNRQTRHYCGLSFNTCTGIWTLLQESNRLQPLDSPVVTVRYYSKHGTTDVHNRWPRSGQAGFSQHGRQAMVRAGRVLAVQGMSSRSVLGSRSKDMVRIGEHKSKKHLCNGHWWGEKISSIHWPLKRDLPC